MNFKLKALVAAVAFAAAGSAFAAVQPGNQQTSSKQGEVVFYAFGYDANGNAATYVKDLGVAFDTFTTTPGFAKVDLDTDNNWTSFLNAGLTGSQWGVFATQKTSAATTGAASAGAIRLLTTAAGNDATQAMSNANMTTALGNANLALVALNAGSTDYATNSSYYFAPATVDGFTPSGNFGAFLGSDYNTTGVFFNATNALGTTTTAQFFNVSRGLGSNAAGVPVVTDVDATKVWTLNAGNELSYVAAVPEPETYAMMAAGLLMLGAVARRRRA
jgi:hypothetical protein